ncbi:hypothetical protein BCIN_11g01170 [Botrytis cinerea B05.10]|uniref:Uncharacterized protein n=1 Tax=Botryotinia fuckeliana (strain B05.10) TaxID=332648 RepID=A0A384JWR2_BOTFB|nr:hypothetical protein BCIN_11g01170 [Botrytis cinerea B05.10]ATZ54784.1 hypothetical protein BCIN_11g01170 [Botrytis cinerea B05.10]
MTSKNLLRDLFNTSKSTSSTEKTPHTQRRSRFFRNLDDDQKMEKIERHELVECAFQQYQRKYPNQWNKLKWEASNKRNNETYDGPSEDDPDSIHIEWHEATIQERSENKDKGLKRPISPVKRDSEDKVAKGIAVAKKALCFGSLTPDE